MNFLCKCSDFRTNSRSLTVAIPFGLPDRNSASNGSRGLEPILRFVQQSNPRYVLVIEDTATMNLQVSVLSIYCLVFFTMTDSVP